MAAVARPVTGPVTRRGVVGGSAGGRGLVLCACVPASPAGVELSPVGGTGAVAVTLVLVLVPASRARQQRQGEECGERAAYAHGLAYRTGVARTYSPGPLPVVHSTRSGGRTRGATPLPCFASAVLGHGSDVLGKKVTMKLGPVRRALAAACVLPLLLAGCTEAEPTPEMPDPTTSSPTATETETGPVEPTLPPEAEGDGVEAAEAFVAHYFATSTTHRRQAIQIRFASWRSRRATHATGVSSIIDRIYKRRRRDHRAATTRRSIGRSQGARSPWTTGCHLLPGRRRG